MSDFEGAARSDSHHIDARLRIAAVLHEGGDLDKAIVAWRQVLDIEPQNQLARRRLIECRDLMTARQTSLIPKD
jgi:cytochrome c-type biogenesis protein CcmH/NrfG